MKKQTANILTGCRIIFSIWMLFCPVFSGCFYALYLLCGLSDMADGTIARKINATSEFGAGLDTVADLILTAVSLLKFLPVIQIPEWLWQWMLIIAVIKISSIAWCFMVSKKIKSLHTIANKMTGLCLFLLPLSLPFLDLQYSAPVVCILATFSAMQEVFSELWAFLKRKAVP